MERIPIDLALGQIKRFNEEVVVPAFLEIKPTLERDKKRVTIMEGMAAGNNINQEILHIMHPRSLSIIDAGGIILEKGEPCETPILGHSMIVEEIPPESPPDAGRFFYSIEFNIDAPEVYTRPIVMYYMNFNQKFHKFEHRFDQEIANHIITEITKYHILNHFLNSFDYYRIYHKTNTRPPDLY